MSHPQKKMNPTVLRPTASDLAEIEINEDKIEIHPAVNVTYNQSVSTTNSDAAIIRQCHQPKNKNKNHKNFSKIYCQKCRSLENCSTDDDSPWSPCSFLRTISHKTITISKKLCSSTSKINYRFIIYFLINFTSIVFFFSIGVKQISGNLERQLINVTNKNIELDNNVNYFKKFLNETNQKNEMLLAANLNAERRLEDIYEILGEQRFKIDDLVLGLGQSRGNQADVKITNSLPRNLKIPDQSSNSENLYNSPILIIGGNKEKLLKTEIFDPLSKNLSIFDSSLGQFIDTSNEKVGWQKSFGFRFKNKIVLCGGTQILSRQCLYADLPDTSEKIKIISPNSLKLEWKPSKTFILPQLRASAQVVTTQNKIFIIGGYSSQSSSIEKSILMVDKSGPPTFQILPENIINFPKFRHSCLYRQVDDSVYCSGGLAKNSPIVQSNLNSNSNSNSNPLTEQKFSEPVNGVFRWNMSNFESGFYLHSELPYEIYDHTLVTDDTTEQRLYILGGAKHELQILQLDEKNGQKFENDESKSDDYNWTIINEVLPLKISRAASSAPWVRTANKLIRFNNIDDIQIVAEDLEIREYSWLFQIQN